MFKNISPNEAKRMIDEENAVIIDIRDPDEYAREHIEGARLMPLSVFTLLPPAPDRERPAIFHCRTGTRAKGSAETLEKHGFSATYLMEGGFMGWKKAGLPVVSKEVPIPIPRQLQIVSGGLITILSLLNFFMPFFNWLILFVGANLFFAGYSGICFMAKILKYMPWNKKKP